MDQTRWQLAKTIFRRALERPTAERGAFLDEACGGDADLLESVKLLLEADETDSTFIDRPAAAELDTDPSALIPDSGDRFGAYRLVRELGAGGMGRVFLAERADEAFEKRVALKFVRHDVGSRSALERFLAERRILARLEHPNIARLLDGGVSESGIPYLVMEYVDGQEITDYCDTRRLPIRERLRLFQDVCAAIQHAHQQLIIHRDLKPSNILVTSEGDVKLLDFGIAKLLTEDPASDGTPVTRTGMRLMTPEYASPEQVLGEDITTATDVYTLGIILYELLTGNRPYTFMQRTFAEIERIVCRETPRRPSTALTDPQTTREQSSRVGHLRSTEPARLSRQVQGDLDMIALKALRKEPERRYASAAALSDDVDRYLKGQPVSARPDTPGYRVRKFMQRNRLAVASSAAVAVAIAGLVGFYTLRLTQERDRARLEAEKAAQTVSFLQGMLAAPRPELDGVDVTVVEVLDDAAATLEEELGDQPDIEAQVRSTIAYSYRELGRYRSAREQVREVLDYRESRPDAEPELLAQTIADYARILHDEGTYDSAEVYYERSIALYRDRAPEDSGLGDTLNDFAVLLSDVGRYEESIPVYEEAIARGTREYGERHLNMAPELINLSTSYHFLGEMEPADSLLAEAVGILVEKGGSEFVLAQALHNLAFLRANGGDLSGADTLFRQTLEIRQRILSPDNPETAITMQGIAAAVAYPRGDLGEAEEMVRGALDIYARAFPDGHPFEAVSLTTLGKIRIRQGRPREAEETLREAVDVLERMLPEGHHFTENSRSWLGEALLRQGRYEAAEPLLIRGFEGLREAPGASPDEIDDARARLARLYEAWGRPRDAARYRG